MRRILAFVALLAAGLFWQPAEAQAPQPPLEAYGELPGLRGFAISPDGEHVAFLARNDGKDLVLLYTLATGELNALTNVDNISARGLMFGDNKHVILIASHTTTQIGFRGQWEDSAAFSLNIETGKQKVLLRGSKNLFPAQSGLGNIVGRYAKKARVFMSAYSIDSRRNPPNYVYLVNLDTGAASIHEKGNNDTVDWILTDDGTVIAREDYANDRNIYRIWTYVSGKPKLIYETESDRIPFSLIGMKPDKSALIVVDKAENADGYSAVYEMDFEGNLSDPIFGRDDAEILGIYVDDDRIVHGVRYSGSVPSYEFFDPAVKATIEEMRNKLPGASVSIQAMSKDWSQVLYSVFAGDTAGSYILQNRDDDSYKILAVSRENIPAAAIGQVVAFSYPARDGLDIPAILTWPAGTTAETRKNLPLVVMPHGGPASHDGVTFDWMAQYFANRGYVVLQPNFRGSTGFGAAFEEAGRGEWGAKMQDDITDGVEALINSGVVNPDRTCIVGASYGGYAALAGGAFTPDLYKCVVAIAPVSDLPLMIKFEKDSHKKGHWAIDYWEEQMGDEEKQKSASPINSVDAFQAPVLLIHGKDDTVVPIEQSRVMEAALTKAGKQVSFVQMKGEDHWLSDGETRIVALRAMADFVDENIGQE
ncbi:MAG: S9 family peptidase [Hyphomonas sp.]|nr:S9 family peptidase [Hyphomonas sp.]